MSYDARRAWPRSRAAGVGIGAGAVLAAALISLGTSPTASAAGDYSFLFAGDTASSAAPVVSSDDDPLGQLLHQFYQAYLTEPADQALQEWHDTVETNQFFVDHPDYQQASLDLYNNVELLTDNLSNLQSVWDQLSDPSSFDFSDLAGLFTDVVGLSTALLSASVGVAAGTVGIIADIVGLTLSDPNLQIDTIILP